MRDVGVIAFAQETVENDRERNEVEFIIPVVQEAVRRSGMGRHDIDFTISGSCDYLSGGPFTFVAGLDGAGAWPPVRESHVEMDAAWALYEAWVAIQTGEIDCALIYGFGKSSLSDDVYQTFTLQADPYTVTPLWPSLIHLAGLQASALLDSGGATERDLAEIAARSARDALRQPACHPQRGCRRRRAARAAGRPTRRCGTRTSSRSPTGRARWSSPPPTSLESIAIARRGFAASTIASTRRTSACGISRRASRPGGPVRKRVRCKVGSTLPNFTRSSAATKSSSREALGLDRLHRHQPVGWSARREPADGGRARSASARSPNASGPVTPARGIAHATQGPCLQQNLVCILEGE